MKRRFEKAIIDKAVAKSSSKLREVFEGILPTNFGFELEQYEKEVLDTLGSGGNEYKLIRKVLKGKLYGIIDVRLEQMRPKMTACSSAIISYIIVNLPINSNYIEFTNKDISNFYRTFDGRTYTAAISELVNKKVISLTNRKSLYIVNHNYIFKGNIIKFIENYNKKYENIVPSLDENGNIIIED